jgi:hypothetical protein
MKTILAIFGGFVLTLSILGAFGVGNFVMIYSPNKINCEKEVK